ncbi:MAG: transcription-repair coupling factor [Alphaproteobacteria bacterium]
MIELEHCLDRAGALTIGSTPAGVDALLVAGYLTGSKGRRVIHVARDDARMAQFAASVGFFAPDVRVIEFPAWDCLPYDRTSPNGHVVARRIDALTTLAGERDGPDRPPTLIATTVNALLQRVPPAATFANAALRVRAGERLDREALLAFFESNGYVRATTVREPGEYAVRGGIVDVYPTGSDLPLRLDLFGDELEEIRGFDPVDQRTTDKRKRFVLSPVSEITLTPERIRLFREGYRGLFGATAAVDPIYEAVSAGQRYAGMEHWLPLFYPELDSILDYLPGVPVTFDEQTIESRDARLDTIQDYYQARSAGGAAADSGGVYRPVPPERLYLSAGDWDAHLATRPTARFTAFEIAGEKGSRDAGARAGPSFTEARARRDAQLFDAVVAAIDEEHAARRRVIVCGLSTGARDRLNNLLAEHQLQAQTRVDSWSQALALPPRVVGLVVSPLESGFRIDGLTVMTEQDILGERMARPARRQRRAENVISEATSLAVGDLVVHRDHGIGRYDGLVAVEAAGAPHDCLRVLYAGDDKLFVPVENIEVLSRYGAGDAESQLDKLGGAGWQSRKARVKQRIREIAEHLIRVAAEREVRTAEKLATPAGIYDEFAARFPYPETDDQLRAIEQTLADMASGKPMDRLICGDVGFGKTEVALRAAFVAAMAGGQVAVVVPTTLLCRQHYEVIRQRFADLPLRIAQLSRLVSARDATLIRREVAEGTMDIVVGTHALLAKSTRFKRLSLLIVDEEQHFGVAQKERLKQLKSDVHVLTLTATPIPRTLQMALSGVRTMSMIATPPVDRLAVRTFVQPYDPVVLREAILREHYRGGQTFYVCPRVRDLETVRERLVKLVPEIKFAVAHGQLAASDLEAVMTDFYERKFDLLLSTQIVESGLDLPNANTIIIHRADMFGLAQLYQLRGRVGRGKIRAYAYLTTTPGKALTGAAEQRLRVMQTLDSLGAGFSLASYDLDIRGAGNLLGEEQSGQIREVGVELYQQMLEEAVAEARGRVGAEMPDSEWSPQITIGVPVLIPEDYVPDLGLRLSLYRRAADLADKAEIESFAAELIDRFGSLPDGVENLLQIVEIKNLCRSVGVDKLDAGPKGAVLTFRDNRFANPQGLIAFITGQAGKVQIRPDHKLVYRRDWTRIEDRVKGARFLLRRLLEVVNAAEQRKTAVS